MIPLLDGIRILEVGAVVLGPFAGQILADLGADVIKVEPLNGDIARSSHPQSAGTGALFINNNRNKRAVAIDLKHPEGQAAIRRLIERSDVLLHNMRTEAAERLGLGYNAVTAVNPEIIHCSAIGFGQRGRYRDRPAFDDVIQAASGLAGLARDLGGEPQFVPTIIADKVAALYVVYGILASLVARGRGRRGPMRVEVPMFEVLAAFILNEHLADATFKNDGRPGYPRVLLRDRRPHRTRDGWIAVLPYTADQWRRFLGEVGHSDICSQAWFADASERNNHLDTLYQIVATVLPTRTTAEWMTLLSDLDVPCSQVSHLGDLIDDPHLADVGFFNVDPSFPPEIKRALPQPVVFAGVASRPDQVAPTLGADTRSILRDCGYTDRQIGEMISMKIVQDSAPASPKTESETGATPNGGGSETRSEWS